MPINDWPASERPREKLLERGAAALSDAELLAIFLRTGLPGLTAIDLARRLLCRFGGLRGLLDATPAELCKAAGIGLATAAQLTATRELGRRHLLTRLSRETVLESPDATRHLLTTQLRHRPSEVFLGLFLDNRHRVIACEELFHGTIDGATVHAREVVRRALELNAAALIVAHNHPSGVAEPSQADRALTRRLGEALALVEVRLLDHFIVGDGRPVSLAERGLM